GGDNEVVNQFGEGTVKHLQINRHTDEWYSDVVGPVQLVPHELDQPAEAVAEEICAAEVEGEQQVPLPEGQPELQAAATPETIGPVLGA
ncbi:disease resistance protein, partial [Trifolium medium]|nr:disease resistance protein [Trifolium medium]